MSDSKRLFGAPRRTLRSSLQDALHTAYELRLWLAMRTRAGRAAEQDFIAITEIVQAWDRQRPRQVKLSRSVTVQLSHYRDDLNGQPLARISGAGALLMQMLMRYYDSAQRGGFMFVTRQDGERSAVIQLTYSY
jgi:hypothetical protein